MSDQQSRPCDGGQNTMRINIPLSVMTAALLACPGLAQALPPGVRDEAGFFKPETITAANKIISEIKQEDKKDVLIETFLHIPKDKEKDAANAGTNAAFFKAWAFQRVREEQLNGVYVLVCKEPSYLQVDTGVQTGKQFSAENGDHLDKLLLASFKNKKYDDGLLEGVRYVQSALKDKNAEVGDHVHSGGGVHDAAHFFKPDAITKADEIISAIKRDEKKELVVETFLHAPEGKEQEAANPDTKDDFFKDWADQRGGEQKVNGVYVLICKKPTYIKVVADHRTGKIIFTEEERNHLSKLLQTSFHNKNYDDGLLEGVRYVQSALNWKPGADTDGAAAPPWPTTGTRPNRGGTGAGGSGIGAGSLAIGGLLCVGLVVLVAIGIVLMVVTSLFRAFHRGPAGYGPGGYGSAPPGGGYGGYGGGYGGGQGGGFLSSMLGGMFGGAAGGWAYDRFFGGHQSSNRGPTPREDGGSMPPQDPGYTAGGGGDFGGGGDTGGGADFGGGGDAGGGGDFGGGGDTGGGGSF
ncbi:MAG TPA: hypothetical protein DDY78_13075 [Planctomycetales bacterium]|nr:hypothetical protein [Planctomycetales bacterium]